MNATNATVARCLLLGFGAAALLFGGCSAGSSSDPTDDTGDAGARAGDTDPEETNDAGPTRKPVDDAAAAATLPTALVTGMKKPRGVAVDAQFVYFGSIVDNAIYKVSIQGGTADRVDMGTGVSAPWVHAVDDTFVYFSNSKSGNDGAIGRVPKAGGAPVILATNVNPWGASVDATNIYFTDQRIGTVGAVKKVAKDCAAPCTAVVVAPEQEFPLGITSQTGEVYWTNHDADVTYAYPGGPETGRTWKGTLRKWSTSTTSPNAEATTVMTGLKLPGGVVITGGRAFVSSTGDTSMHVFEFEGSKDTVIPDVGEGFWMTTDEAWVYWMSGGAGKLATLYRMRTDGTVPDAIASRQGGPIGLAVTSTAIYWANHDSGEIMRLDKK